MLANVKNNAAAQETCRRLIHAAGEVFAEQGLHAATIKQITDRAGVNVAAVNYHFRDKFELYAAVIRYALTSTRQPPPFDELKGSARNRLRQSIRCQVEDIFDPNRPAWRGPLLAHEFTQPTAALDAVIGELLRPRADLTRRIVREIVGPAVPEKQVLSATFSIGAQVIFYLYHAELIRRLHPDLASQYSVDDVADHIVDFSMPGLRAMRQRYRMRQRYSRKRRRR